MEVWINYRLNSLSFYDQLMIIAGACELNGGDSRLKMNTS
jgi:hypothetical protein